MEPLSDGGSPHPPSHIVVFRKTSEHNAEMVARAMGGSVAHATVAGHLELSPAEPKRAVASVFPRLAAAAVDLTGEEADRLRRDPEVVAVVPNDICRLPPYTIEPGADIAAAVSPVALAQSAGGDTLTAFLYGLRSAADAALEYQAGLVASSAKVVAAAAKHGWPLELVGIGSGYKTASGQGVKVAVLDTGIDRKHPDLASRLQDPADVMSFVPGESADDGDGHGTHCAGVIAGAQKPAKGKRFGVAPQASLLIGKVLDDDGFGTVEQILQGIEWAAGRGARIISMSLEIERQVDQQPSAAFEAIASRLLAETPGILLVAATGNASQRPHYIAPVFDPAACKSILAVAAIDAQRKVYEGSCGQRDALAEVDCCAPGVAVRSAWPGKRYQSVSGTSMATAHVSGLAALWLDRNPTWSAVDLWRALEGSCAAPNAPASDFGRGLAQAP